jgi:hypothetical protein
MFPLRRNRRRRMSTTSDSARIATPACLRFRSFQRGLSNTPLCLPPRSGARKCGFRFFAGIHRAICNDAAIPNNRPPPPGPLSKHGPITILEKGERYNCRSQWPRGLRHGLSSPAHTLGSRVRIPLEAWMSACVYSVCAVLCVGSGLATG